MHYLIFKKLFLRIYYTYIYRLSQILYHCYNIAISIRVKLLYIIIVIFCCSFFLNIPKSLKRLGSKEGCVDDDGVELTNITLCSTLSLIISLLSITISLIPSNSFSSSRNSRSFINSHRITLSRSRVWIFVILCKIDYNSALC